MILPFLFVEARSCHEEPFINVACGSPTVWAYYPLVDAGITYSAKCVSFANTECPGYVSYYSSKGYITVSSIGGTGLPTCTIMSCFVILFGDDLYLLDTCRCTAIYIAHHIITCSAVIPDADWPIGVRTGAVHTL